jgi:hypothetical protein
VENPRRNVLLATLLVCLLTGVLGGAEVYLGQRVWPESLSGRKLRAIPVSELVPPRPSL